MKITVKFITILFTSLSFCTISLAMQKKEMTVAEQKTFFAKVKKNDFDYVQNVCLANYNIDIQDNKTKRTALHIAAQKGHTRLCSLLLARGADYSIKDKKGDTARRLAERNNKKETMQEFDRWIRVQNEQFRTSAAAVAASTQTSTLNSSSSSRSNADFSLISAVKRNDLESIKSLLKSGVDVNEYSLSEDVTPLIQAVIQGKLEIVKLLLNAGADISKPGKNGTLALNLAIDYKHTSIVKVLYEATQRYLQQQEGSSPLANIFAEAAAAAAATAPTQSSATSSSSTQSTSKSKTEETLEQQLITAIKKEQSQMAIELIKKPSINLDETDNEGFTPLMYAVHFNLLEAVKALIKYGCSVNKLVDGKIYNENEGEFYYSVFHRVIFDDRREMLDYFLSLGDKLEVNLADSLNWMSPLMIAVRAKKINVVRSLLEHPSIDVNLPNKDDQTALDLALNMGLNDIQKLLEAKGAKTYLMINVEKRNVEAVKVLCKRIKEGENRACLEHRDPASKKTVMQIAQEIENERIIALIIEAARAV